MSRTILVTGGAGFIGSNFIHWVARERPDWRLVNLDALTYAGNLENLTAVEGREGYAFLQGDVARPEDVAAAFDAAGDGAEVVHFAAESHVDRSIQSGMPFVRTNVVGTQVLLDAAREREVRRFLHVSTDEVYGALGDTGRFTEDSPLRPNSPYAATKAASDLLVRAAVRTHGLPAVITRCSNNFGPYQFPEKVIPLVVANALEDRPLPVYGEGHQVRDWIYVEDHCEALAAMLEADTPGEVYNVGGGHECTNLELVRRILGELGKPETLIRFVEDRPGHDWRYALDASRLERDLGWRPHHTFERALRETIRWYLDHVNWLDRVRSGAYREYYERQYGKRIRE
jgi:dTDP-glucose 4,6-dehydratase